MAGTGGTRNLETGQIGGSSSARCKAAGPARIPAPSCLSRAIEGRAAEREARKQDSVREIFRCVASGGQVLGARSRLLVCPGPHGEQRSLPALSPILSLILRVLGHMCRQCLHGGDRRGLPAAPVGLQRPHRSNGGTVRKLATLNGEGLLIYMEGRPPREMATLPSPPGGRHNRNLDGRDQRIRAIRDPSLGGIPPAVANMLWDLSAVCYLKRGVAARPIYEDGSISYGRSCMRGPTPDGGRPSIVKLCLCASRPTTHRPKMAPRMTSPTCETCPRLQTPRI